MEEFFASGRAADAALAVLLIETVVRILRGGRAKAGSIVWAMLPGVFLLLALRAALTGAGWPWVAVWLTAALPAHLIDMRRRPV